MSLRLIIQVDILRGESRVLQQYLASRGEELRRIQHHIRLKHLHLLDKKGLSDNEKGLNVMDTIDHLSALGNEASASDKLANGLSIVSVALNVDACTKS